MSPASSGLCSEQNHEATILIPSPSSRYFWWFPFARDARISNSVKMALLCILGMVLAFNGKSGRNFKELIKMVETCKDEFLKFDLDYQQMVVLYTKICQGSNSRYSGNTLHTFCNGSWDIQRNGCLFRLNWPANIGPCNGSCKEAPSGFTGCKGVIACWPGKDDGILLSIRCCMKSLSKIGYAKYKTRKEGSAKTIVTRMYTTKITTTTCIPSIVSWMRFQPGFLSRQIITLLSALRVRDDVFTE